MHSTARNPQGKRRRADRLLHTSAARESRDGIEERRLVILPLPTRHLRDRRRPRRGSKSGTGPRGLDRLRREVRAQPLPPNRLASCAMTFSAIASASRPGSNCGEAVPLPFCGALGLVAGQGSTADQAVAQSRTRCSGAVLSSKRAGQSGPTSPRSDQPPVHRRRSRVAAVSLAAVGLFVNARYTASFGRSNEAGLFLALLGLVYCGTSPPGGP
jgi:hypothetical protein